MTNRHTPVLITSTTTRTMRDIQDFPLTEGRGRRAARGAADSEIRLYLDKLRDVVPEVGGGRRLGRLELIHHAIEYIVDLQRAVEAVGAGGVHPGMLRGAPPPVVVVPPRAVQET